MAAIMMMAGGTGGHVFPALAVAHVLIDRGHQVNWLGAPESFESRHVPKQGIEMDTINITGLRGKGIKSKLQAPFKIVFSILRALKLFKKRKIELAIGMGGFVSGPGGIAAAILGIPLVIHEQNAIPGLTNKVLAKKANLVCQAFPGTFSQENLVTTGNPVRKDILEIPGPEQRYLERSGPLNIQIIGGSLGAVALNDILPKAIAEIDLELRPIVHHQSGMNKDEITKENYRKAGVDAEITPFVDDMNLVYEWADLLICRSGALTVSELAAVGIPAILVPFPHAVDDHQSANGNYLVDAKAAIMIQQHRLEPLKLAKLLMRLNRKELLLMALAAKKLGHSDAAERVADLAEGVLTGNA